MADDDSSELEDAIIELLDGRGNAEVGAALVLVMAKFLLLVRREHGDEMGRGALAMYQRQIGQLYEAGAKHADSMIGPLDTKQ